MAIDLVTLDHLRVELRSDVSEETFLQRYQGAFLLAMGFLEVEQIQAGRSTAQAIRKRGHGVAATAAVSFGSRLRHDAMQTHPLAGCAFFIRAVGARRRLTLGRGPDRDITIPDPSVSERHCYLEVTDEGVIVADTDSTNGTSVNLERVEQDQPQVLADEDILTIGRYSFQMLSARTMYNEVALLNALEEERPDE